ncbi:hypothetical protein EV175_005195, partial [Coemansia sp. RSA 1933]
MFASVLSRTSFALRVAPAVKQQLLASTMVSPRRSISTTGVSGKNEAETAVHEQHHSYLQDLLDEDDANAPWHQTPVEMVSREVQSLSSSH